MSSSNKALSLSFDNLDTLLSAYMPFLEYGGVFVPTRDRFELGQRVFLLLSLPGSNDLMPVSGRVAWVSPAGMSGRRLPGIGVHFDPGESGLCATIEALLGERLAEPHMSYTL
ncbi:PilZ domain-containing protein [Larsenimonas suaedae]|uniref:PilZ domain-containing protein n=1 Tax=Larsenimonas suaedae TaxID=1851019 RepID=A0ABU1GUX6_9GAMM|nr:PilZ domain-containing protein [Larsenimonas suaedae]MCM2971129.1 PilZ domain-containing protein [Larsenimonas suaedae]MDR5895838.1 PilZ domain-containing protein [Larsenimonas suaedae]